MATLLAPLILDQLALRESRQLALVVAVRKALGPGHRIKGDLGAMVKSCLQKFVAAKVVVDTDGVFSLIPRLDRRI